MNQIKIIDTTLTSKERSFNFKEKIEIARQLEKLNVNTIELPQIENVKTDILFAKTVSSFVNNSILSVAAGGSIESIENAALALSVAPQKRIRIELPVSPVGMEYTCHKKGDKMLAWIEKVITFAKEKCDNIEYCALDSTRADREFLMKAITIAVSCGATSVTLCDNSGEMMPDDFAEFASDIASKISVPLNVSCTNINGLASAAAILSVRKGILGIKTSVSGEILPLEAFAGMVKNCGNNYGFAADINNTELLRIVKQINWIANSTKNEKAVVSADSPEYEQIHLDIKDSQKDINNAVIKLGYDLSEEDQVKVYTEFLRVAAKKRVGAKELEAIVASTALQVPATYELVSYLINNGNIISASAQITLQKSDEIMKDVCIGDGPIDAAFLAIDRIIGRHYELDDFQIQSVTEGKEAMGSALVKLRSGGKLYSGNGISTDIIGASIRAYLNAVNKIVYEEA